MSEFDDTGVNIETDFDIEDEYKEDPLVPGGTYRGSVLGVAFDSEAQAIAWTVVLNENGGLCSDGETPIDGTKHYNNNWLPKDGDENIMSKNGRSTKRQAKINFLKGFADDMKISMRNAAEIAEAIGEGLWVGIDVLVTIGIKTFEGRTRNEIKKMKAIEAGSVAATDDIPF